MPNSTRSPRPSPLAAQQGQHTSPCWRSTCLPPTRSRKASACVAGPLFRSITAINHRAPMSGESAVNNGQRGPSAHTIVLLPYSHKTKNCRYFLPIAAAAARVRLSRSTTRGPELERPVAGPLSSPSSSTEEARERMLSKLPPDLAPSECLKEPADTLLRSTWSSTPSLSEPESSWRRLSGRGTLRNSQGDARGCVANTRIRLKLAQWM